MCTIILEGLMIMSSKIYRAKMSLAEEEHRVDEEQGAGGGIDLPSLASKMEQVDLFDAVVDTFVDGAVGRSCCCDCCCRSYCCCSCRSCCCSSTIINCCCC